MVTVDPVARDDEHIKAFPLVATAVCDFRSLYLGCFSAAYILLTFVPSVEDHHKHTEDTQTMQPCFEFRISFSIPQYVPYHTTYRYLPPPCRADLYNRAANGAYLQKSWLDAHYSYAPGGGAVLDPPFQKEISYFLYEDCRPLPPCSCSSLTPETAAAQEALATVSASTCNLSKQGPVYSSIVAAGPLIRTLHILPFNTPYNTSPRPSFVSPATHTALP